MSWTLPILCQYSKIFGCSTQKSLCRLSTTPVLSASDCIPIQASRRMLERCRNVLLFPLPEEQLSNILDSISHLFYLPRFKFLATTPTNNRISERHSYTSIAYKHSMRNQTWVVVSNFATINIVDYISEQARDLLTVFADCNTPLINVGYGQF